MNRCTRRAFLGRMTATGGLLLCPGALPWPLAARAAPRVTAPDAWPQFRGSPALTGVAGSVPPEDPAVLWTYEAGDIIESSAAIADGVVYVGIGDGHLVALDFDTGSPRWMYATENLIGESSPAVGRGTVYVGDLGGRLHAVDRHDGSPRWTFDATAEIKSSPVLVDDLLLIGSYDGHLYALDAGTGELRWQVLTEGPVHATPAIDGGLTFVAGCDERFRAIRLADGRQEFEVSAGAYTGASPVIVDDHAYFGTFNDEVLAVDLRARRIAWHYSDPDRAFPFYASAAVADDRVIVGGRDKLIRALARDTGEALWSFATRARVDSSPAVAGGRVYVGSNDRRFYVLDLETGLRRWAFETGGAITASPAIASARIVIGSQDGVVYCFG